MTPSQVGKGNSVLHRPHGQRAKYLNPKIGLEMDEHTLRVIRENIRSNKDKYVSMGAVDRSDANAD